MAEELEGVSGSEERAGNEEAAQGAASSVAPVAEFDKAILTGLDPVREVASVSQGQGQAESATCELTDGDERPYRAALRSEVAAILMAIFDATSKEDLRDRLALVGFNLRGGGGS